METWEERGEINSRIITELKKTKSKYLTATFYLNSTTPIVNCPDVIGAIFDKRRNKIDSSIRRGELISLYILSLKELVRTRSNQLYDAELLRDNIVLKSSRKDDYSVEFAIGFYFLNSLRSEIPNFMQTYGTFKCKKMEGICPTAGTSFLAIEKIEGVTITEFAKDLSYGDTCLLLLQVYLALIVANKKFEFCHFDLHDGNVMVRKVEPTAITYYIDDSPITIVVPFIAVIIDFGLSRVVHNGEVLTTNFISQPGPNKNRSYIDFSTFLAACIIFGGNTAKLQALQNMIPETHALQRSTGTEFSKPLIRKLLKDITKYEAVKVYTPGTCKRRKRTTPVTSTLDYYESYPYSKNREVDVDRILDNAIEQLNGEFKFPNFVTYSKLYVFFYERHVSSNPVYREFYDEIIRFTQ